MTKSVEPKDRGESSLSLAGRKDRALPAGCGQRLVKERREAAVTAAEDFKQVRGGRTGRALIDAMQACPYPDFELARSVYARVRKPRF